MNSTERLFALKVSLIMSVRMLGLFMLFPVMSVYAGDYESSTPFLIGMAIGIYYTKIGSHIAAINRSKFIIENYPNSSSIPDTLDLMAYNYDQINATKLASDIRIVLSSSYPNYSKNYSID